MKVNSSPARRGIAMIEVTFALVVLSVPVITILTTTQSGVRGTRFNQERMASRMVLADLAGLIRGLPADRLESLEKGGAPEVDLLLENRVAALPDHLRADYRRQIQDIFGTISLSVEKDVKGLKGLNRYRLTRARPDGTSLEDAWLTRPSRRTVPRPAIERI